MFMVFSKDKIVSYLISLSTVAFLFIMSFAITKRNDEILKTSANIVEQNNVQESINDNNSIDGNNTNMKDIDVNSALNETNKNIKEISENTTLNVVSKSNTLSK